jgi:CheY-like chemotaxis protein
MVVDDHAAFRQVVKSLLQPAGAEFAECEDGEQAVAMYVNFRPDVVLMDIAMKGVDGLSATAQIKARFPTARILMLTQYDDPDIREAASLAGACEYLPKHNLSQLPQILQACLSQKA